MVPEQAYETPLDTVTTSIDTSTSSEGFFTKISNMFSFESLAKKLNLSRERCIEIALYGGAGFITGFLCKKYSFYLCLLLFFALILVGLHMIGLITLTVHVDKINSYIGLRSVPSDTNFFMACIQWAKEHLHASISFVVGFIIGVWVA